jgi:hypothetical protein
MFNILFRIKIIFTCIIDILRLFFSYLIIIELWTHWTFYFNHKIIGLSKNIELVYQEDTSPACVVIVTRGQGQATIIKRKHWMLNVFLIFTISEIKKKLFEFKKVDFV